MTSDRAAVPFDYDRAPDRFRVALSIRERFGIGDRPQRGVHAAVARRFLAEGLEPIVDIGSGQGDFLQRVEGRSFAIGLDRSIQMLQEVRAYPVVMADAASLPFAEGSLGAVAALYMLYHLDDPVVALREIFRALRGGGLFAACAPSRDDAPELLPYLPPRPPSTFDAEIGEELVTDIFGSEVATFSWDEPMLELPDGDAVRDYLIGRFTPPHEAAAIASEVEVPLRVTKRGSLWFARKS